MFIWEARQFEYHLFCESGPFTLLKMKSLLGHFAMSNGEKLSRFSEFLCVSSFASLQSKKREKVVPKRR
jgi:hypothetical protein